MEDITWRREDMHFCFFTTRKYNFIAELPRAGSPIPQRKWEPTDARKFGYNVSLRTLREGGGSQERARRGEKHVIAEVPARFGNKSHSHSDI